MNSIKNHSNTIVGYMIDGAKYSRYNAYHWFRYLSKVVKEQGVLLSKEDADAIINSGELTMYQIVTLKRAIQDGTPTNKNVIALNQRTTTPMLRELLRRHGRV